MRKERDGGHVFCEPELGCTLRWCPATNSRSHGGIVLLLKTFSETPFKLCVATRILAVCVFLP